MNEEMEVELTETDSIPDHLEVLEDESAHEAVPIHIRKERKTKAYNETTGQDIENIDTFETKKKLIQKNEYQSMRLYMKPISNSLIFP